MSETGHNPWVERFLPLLDLGGIKRRALLRPAPLTALGTQSKEAACGQLRQALHTAFYPTTQCLRILQRWLDIAYTHSQANYTDHFDYFSRLHREDGELELVHTNLAMCLTGLGGVGKSSLIKAFGRIMPPPQEIITRDSMRVALESYRILRVEVLTNPTGLLRELGGVGAGGGKDLRDKCRYLAYRCGTAFIFADEFQFVTLSSEASANISKMLLALNSLGIPFAYAANFSMLHTLKKRSQQELQRLVDDITEFSPDPPDSSDWQETLAFLKEILPEKFVFDPVGDGAFIHGLCAGTLRNLSRLLVQAYAARHEKGFVGADELYKAYKSAEYANNRNDVLALQQMTNESRRKRTDLWNPFRAVDEVEALERRNAEQRQAQVAQASLLAAMNKDERREHIRAGRQAPATSAANRPAPRKASTAEELLRNSLQFRDGLKGN